MYNVLNKSKIKTNFGLEIKRREESLKELNIKTG
jgi:hypothetical protein